MAISRAHSPRKPRSESPEQAEGKKLDARSDIFSFGAVLYEMVTGRRAFRGDSTASTLAAVLQHDPEAPTRITPQIPRELERIIQRCLRKDPNRRFHSMTDVKVELEELREESESGMQGIVQAPARKRRRTWTYAVVALALLAIAAAIRSWHRQSIPVTTPSQPVPLTSYLGDQDVPDFSPDASEVVFAWNRESPHSISHLSPAARRPVSSSSGLKRATHGNSHTPPMGKSTRPRLFLRMRASCCS